MSEENQIEVNPIDEFIDAIAVQNFNRAKSHWENIIGDKMNDAMEQEKISVANTIFNKVDGEDLDIEEDEEEEEYEDVEEES